MNKSELIELLSLKKGISFKKAEEIINTVFDSMTEAMLNGERIEIRGFGSFGLNFRPPRQGRNPKTGDKVQVPAKYVPHFKAGKELRERVGESRS